MSVWTTEEEADVAMHLAHLLDEYADASSVEDEDAENRIEEELFQYVTQTVREKMREARRPLYPKALRGALQVVVESQPQYWPNWNGPDSYSCSFCNGPEVKAVGQRGNKMAGEFVHEPGCAILVLKAFMEQLPQPEPPADSAPASTQYSRQDASASSQTPPSPTEPASDD